MKKKTGSAATSPVLKPNKVFHWNTMFNLTKTNL